MEMLTEFFSNFFDWMEALPAVWAYATLFIVAYGENVVPPIPGDMVVVFAGYMAGVGLLDLWAVILLSTIGGAAGFMSMYGIGYYVGRRALTSDEYRWLPRTGIESAQRWLNEYGYGVVAANRFLSGARSVISLTVGAAQMKPLPTLLWSSVSAAVWCGLISTGGYFVGDNWRLVVEYVRTYGRWMVIILTTIAVVLAIRWYWTREPGDDTAGDGTVGEDTASDANVGDSGTEAPATTDRAGEDGAGEPDAAKADSNSAQSRETGPSI